MKPSSTAVHEAAHAVIARLFGIDVDVASIVPSESWLGRVSHEHLSNRGEFINGQACELEGAPEEEILVCFAGYAAELRLSPELEQQAKNGCGDDDAKADELLERIDATDEGQLRENAGILVAQHWITILLVAHELDLWGTLDGEEIDELINLAKGIKSSGAIECLINLRTATERIKWADRTSESVRLQGLVAILKLSYV